MKQRFKLNIICFSLVVICMTAVLLSACNSNFSKQCTVEYVAQTGGSILGEVVQDINYGGNGTKIVAVPDTGYEFVMWSDGNTDTERTDFNIKENKTYTAEFRKKTYTITYLAQSGGRLTGVTIQNLSYGESGTQVVAVPDAGYEFVKWSDGNTETNRVEEYVTANKTLTAEFREKICNVNYIVKEGGSISGIANQYIKYGTNGTQVEAVPDIGYKFVGWSDGKTETTRTETNVSVSKTIIATFEKKTFKVEYIANEGGSIRGKTVQKIKYDEFGTLVTAVPQTGYEFVRWSDGETSINHISFNVKENRRIAAEFRKNTYTLQYGTDCNGTIQGNTFQSVQHGESGTSVTALPVDSAAYEFYRWSDGLTTATRTDINVEGDKNITAEFKKRTFTIRYGVNDPHLGLLINLDDPRLQFNNMLPFKIKYGEDAPRLLANSEQNLLGEEYEFLYWSDGSTERERHDTHITSDMTFIAYFGYKIDYIVNGNVGGRIKGKTTQYVLSGDIGEDVTAVSDNGYMFMGWSDLKWEMTRKDDPNRKSELVGEHLYSRNLELIAYFEPIKKTFTYDYGYDLPAPFATTQITLDRNAIEESEFIVPTRKGYHFCGWYADNSYKTRITTETGRYMYGYASFSLETDTLYARWEREGERTDNHKIMMVFVDKVQTTLYSKSIEKNIKIDTAMTALDYQLCNSTATIMSNLLNEWFEGEVIFEVDSYYTTTTITEGFRCSNGGYMYNLMPDYINEIYDVQYLYHNIISVVGIGDYDRNLIGNLAGLANIKNAYVAKDFELSKVRSNIRFQDYIEDRNNGKIELEQTIVETCLHELIHTAEMYFPREDYLDLHNAIAYANRYLGGCNILNTYKPCLLGEFEMNGDKFCVPMKYWKHNMDISVGYICESINGVRVGEIYLVGENVDSNPLWIVGGTVTVRYDSECFVEAVPKEGYRFVRWSDGVTTAIRHDKNIIAFYCVKAIFEKI